MWDFLNGHPKVKQWFHWDLMRRWPVSTFCSPGSMFPQPWAAISVSWGAAETAPHQPNIVKSLGAKPTPQFPRRFYAASFVNHWPKNKKLGSNEGNRQVCQFSSHGPPGEPEPTRGCARSKYRWCLAGVLGTQFCLTLCNPMDGIPPGSSVHGILQARILEWVPFPSPGD